MRAIKVLTRSVLDDLEDLSNVLLEWISEPDRNPVELMRDGGVDEVIELRALMILGADAGVLDEPRYERPAWHLKPLVLIRARVIWLIGGTGLTRA